MRRVALALAALGLAVAGCGGDDQASETTTTTTTTTTETVAVSDPLTCLEDAGLNDVEERAADPWRGYKDSPFYQVAVDELSSPAEARQLVSEAVDVYAVSAGVYVITGPAKPSAGGLIQPDDAAEAEAILDSVAACLGG